MGALRVARAGGGGAQQRPEPVPLVGAAVELARRPEDAVADLVAELEHLRRRALGGQRVERVARVVVHLRGQRRQVLGPRGRDRLLLRIGPEVRVVRVEQDAHAGGLRSARHGEHARQVAVAGGRIDPQAQADPVGAVVGEDLLGQRGAAAVGVRGAGRRLLDGEREVMADDRRPRGAARARAARRRRRRRRCAGARCARRAGGGRAARRACRRGRSPRCAVRRLDRHARRRRVAREADPEALEPPRPAEVDGDGTGAAGGRGGVAVVDGGRARAAGQREVDERAVARGGRCGRGGEAGEDGEGEAARGHAPCMPGQRAGSMPRRQRPAASSHSRIDV